MRKDNLQKIKLLMLLEMLQQESTPEHPLTTAVLCKKLFKIGIKCDRRTLSIDMEALRDFGFDIKSKMVGHEKGYYYDVRTFSIAELKIMIDAIQAAAFVTKEKTDDLVARLAAIGGTKKKEILKSNIVCFNTRKHTNENIYDNVEVLEEAIQAKKQASFLYYDRDEKGNIIYRKEKQRYMVEPMALIFNEDNYYLMCYSSKYDGITNYRVDRMEMVAVEEEPVSENAKMDTSDIAQFTKQAFKMYGGEMTDITLEFNDDLVGVIHDKFGENTSIIRTASNKCAASVQVQVSPTFWGWLFQFGKKMKILSPGSLMEEYRKKITELEDNCV
ncbi:MAG: WYL domain-containing protein [Lachnospiraceae bacterium]|nr:WYL domain-containing protein [Lachnospiraceae bacterium]